jgi:hypothetical protein
LRWEVLGLQVVAIVLLLHTRDNRIEKGREGLL